MGKGRKKHKIGRNDPCHCGSGKKYKRCCIKKDREINSKPKTDSNEGTSENKLIGHDGTEYLSYYFKSR